ncbi:hypothetical protein [Nocardia sp. BMG111209]|nr:hypothetical protein [Nocardia sp. BMG111209]
MSAVTAAAPGRWAAGRRETTRALEHTMSPNGSASEFPETETRAAVIA